MTSIVRDAATIVLVRDGEAGVEVYVTRRGSSAPFMPERYVYPGGRVDNADVGLRGRLRPRELSRVGALGGGVSEERADAIFVAAIRECFEEAGVLFADPQASESALQTWRGRVVASSAAFETMVETLDLSLRADALVLFDHWITPSFEARRYDTRFFVARVPGAQVPVADDVEVHDGRWWTPRAVLDAYAQRQLLLAPPTLCTLQDLAGMGSADEVVRWAAERVVVPILPKLAEIDGTPTLLLPGDPRYPSERPFGGPHRIQNIDGLWVRRT